MLTWQEENWPEGKRRRRQEKILAMFWLREQRSWKENSLAHEKNIIGTWFWWAFVMHSSPLIPQIKSPLSSWWKRWGLISQRRWRPKGPLMHCLPFPFFCSIVKKMNDSISTGNLFLNFQERKLISVQLNMIDIVLNFCHPYFYANYRKLLNVKKGNKKQPFGVAKIYQTIFFELMIMWE